MADGMRNTASGVSFANGAWPTADTALFFPLALPWPYLVSRMFWGNGSTVNNNKDIGIYSVGGAKIWSAGSTGESGASVLQYVSVSVPFILPPGQYYLALACGATTNHIWQVAMSLAEMTRAAGMLQMANALPLPDVATFAECTAVIAPLCGITRTASGF